MLPTFIIVGAAKAATTWTGACLEEHPEVFMRGEIRFFSLHYDEGLPWYEAHFRGARAGQKIGEKSPSYIYYPEVPCRMRDANPALRLLFLLRDPVQRAYSAYCMNLQSGHARGSPAEALRPGTRWVDDGFYHRHLQRFRGHFPDDQIQVAVYDDLKRDPRRFLADIYEFVGVDPTFTPSRLEQRVMHRKGLPRFARLHRAAVGVAARLSRTSRGMERLVQSVARRGGSRLLHALDRAPDFPPFPPEHERRLAALYRPDVAALSEDLGRDFVGLWLDRYAVEGDDGSAPEIP